MESTLTVRIKILIIIANKQKKNRFNHISIKICNVKFDFCLTAVWIPTDLLIFRSDSSHHIFMMRKVFGLLHWLTLPLTSTVNNRLQPGFYQAVQLRLVCNEN